MKTKKKKKISDNFENLIIIRKIRIMQNKSFLRNIYNNIESSWENIQQQIFSLFLFTSLKGNVGKK